MFFCQDIMSFLEYSQRLSVELKISTQRSMAYGTGLSSQNMWPNVPSSKDFFFCNAVFFPLQKASLSDVWCLVAVRVLTTLRPPCLPANWTHPGTFLNVSGWALRLLPGAAAPTAALTAYADVLSAARYINGSGQVCGGWKLLPPDC